MGSCFIGFDGFIDEIISVVDKRTGSSITCVESLADFGQRVAGCAGKSGNFELVTRETRIGGNGPLLTRALLNAGHTVSLAGAIEDPLFSQFREQLTDSFPLCSPGRSQALEFNDGKMFLGNLGPLNALTLEDVWEKIPTERWITLLDSVDLFASVNWTMVPVTTAIWGRLLDEVVPSLSDRRRSLFVDLADPAKRPASELMEALALLRRFQPKFHVTLGLNRSEAEQIAKRGTITTDNSEQVAKEISKEVGIDVVLHNARFAAAASGDRTVQLPVPFCEQPKISTGAGDNFNAGYCDGLMRGTTLEECLGSAINTANRYIRMDEPPVGNKQSGVVA
jgi:sugar/nucleoside kinase (ribokinase family)